MEMLQNAVNVNTVKQFETVSNKVSLFILFFFFFFF